VFKNQKVVVIMPACNAAETLCRTYEEVMAQQVVDQVIVVDDASTDQTTRSAKTLAHTFVHTHPQNLGWSRPPSPTTPATG
jgi:glycosyltransferase involved in cell wall biosynthesis